MQEPHNEQEISSSVGAILGSPQGIGSVFSMSKGGARSAQIGGVGGWGGFLTTVLITWPILLTGRCAQWIPWYKKNPLVRPIPHIQENKSSLFSKRPGRAGDGHIHALKYKTLWLQDQKLHESHKLWCAFGLCAIKCRPCRLYCLFGKKGNRRWWRRSGS